jgi:glycosyltransferase involved in cell wall biosynthesis
MKFSIEASERLLMQPPIRSLLPYLFQLCAAASRYTTRGRYHELSCLLRAYRALANVPPMDVPDILRKSVSRRIMELDTEGNRIAFLSGFVSAPESQAARRQFQSFGLANQVRLRLPRNDPDPRREGDVMILKPPLSDGEKGVLMIMYSPSIALFAAIYDLERISRKYRIILEPSTWGYQDPDIILYLNLPTDVIVQAQYQPDYEFIREIGRNLMPTRIGAGDWVDPNRFVSREDTIKEFDVVMVASWQKLKRHELLFRAIGELGDRIQKVALVGLPSEGRERHHVEREAQGAGVLAKLVWFESVPHEQVAEIIRMSRVSVMLSSREGASRVIYESLFCDVPIIIMEDNVGVNRDHINPRTGVVAVKDRLGSAIVHVLDHQSAFHPRDWALTNTGYKNATDAVQAILQMSANRLGEPWTQDILPKVNAPNLRYVSEPDWKMAQAWYHDLEQCLRTS